MADNNPNNSSHMRIIGERDRSPEFRHARAKLLETVDTMFTEVETARVQADRQFKFGVAVFGMLGIERTTVQNPLGGFSLMSERKKVTPGLYFGRDQKDGQDVLFIRRPDKSAVEVRRDALLTGLILPANPTDAWDPAPRGASNADSLFSVVETQEDQGSVGFSVTASGNVMRLHKDPGEGGMGYSRTIGPKDANGVASAQLLLDLVRQDIFID